MNIIGKGRFSSLVLLSLLALSSLNSAKANNPRGVYRKAAPSANASQSYDKVPDFLANLDQKSVDAWEPKQMPLKVFFLPPGPDIECFSNDMFVIFRDSCQVWSDVSNKRVSFVFTEDRKEADIKVKFSDDRRTATDPREAGNASVDSGYGGIDCATIELYTRDSRGHGYGSGAVFKSICLHEIGHALGIVGHSPCPRDVMAPTVPFNELTPIENVKLTQRDINTLNRIYTETASLFLRRKNALAMAQSSASGGGSKPFSPYQEMSREPQKAMPRNEMIDEYADRAVYMFACKQKNEACSLLEKAIVMAQQSRTYPRSSLARLREQLLTYKKHLSN